jgi:hypothetical protein
MSDDPRKSSKTGLRVGDFNVRPTLSVRTDNSLDTEANRERARRAEEDKRAAQHSPGASDGSEYDETDDAAQAAVDQSIEEARRRLAGPNEDIPILLHDPVTGRIIRNG